MRRRQLTEKRWQDRLDHIERLAEVRGASFAGDSAEAKAERLARALLDSAFFARTYLPHYFSAPFAPFHRELFRIAEEERFAVIAAARGHGKSVVFTFADTLWRVARAELVDAWEADELRDRNRHLADALERALAERGMDSPQRIDPFIVLSHCIEEGAEEYTYDVKIELEENGLLISDFGELVEDKGKNYGDFRAGGVRVVAIGLSTSRRGLRSRQDRPTLWKIDDADDDRTISSEKVRDRHFKRLTAFVVPAMDPARGRVQVIGNIVHRDGVVGRIWHDQDKPEHEQRFPTWAKVRFDARDEDGRVLWPDRFPDALLTEIERMDPEVFAVEYMNDPPSGRDRPFGLLQYYDREAVTDSKLPTVMIADPALGRTRSSDLQFIGVVKYDPRAKAFLVWRSHLTRLPPPAWRRLFLDIYDQEEPDLAGIEAVGFQELLIVMVEELGDTEELFPSVVRIEQHQAKDLRILSLVPLNDRGRLLFPSDGSCRALEKLFSAYPDGKKDGPDGVEMAVRLLRRHVRGSSAGEIRHGRSRRQRLFARAEPEGEDWVTGRTHRVRRFGRGEAL